MILHDVFFLVCFRIKIKNKKVLILFMCFLQASFFPSFFLFSRIINWEISFVISTNVTLMIVFFIKKELPSLFFAIRKLWRITHTMAHLIIFSVLSFSSVRINRRDFNNWKRFFNKPMEFSTCASGLHRTIEECLFLRHCSTC